MQMLRIDTWSEKGGLELSAFELDDIGGVRD